MLKRWQVEVIFGYNMTKNIFINLTEFSVVKIMFTVKFSSVSETKTSLFIFIWEVQETCLCHYITTCILNYELFWYMCENEGVNYCKSQRQQSCDAFSTIKGGILWSTVAINIMVIKGSFGIIGLFQQESFGFNYLHILCLVAFYQISQFGQHCKITKKELFN